MVPSADAHTAPHFTNFTRTHDRWLDTLVFRARFGKPIQHLLRLSFADNAHVATQKLTHNWEKEQRAWRPSLLRALVRTFLLEILVAGILKAIWSVLIVLSSFYFVLELVNFISDKSKSTWYGWVMSVSFLVACILLSMAYQQMVVKNTQVGIRMRAAVVTLLYEKAFRLDMTHVSTGEVLNLVTNDCSRLMESSAAFHFLWSGALESLAIVGLVIYLTGYSGFLALGVIVLLIIAQVLIGLLVSYTRKKNIDTTDFRVSVVSEIFASIKLVKLYAWEDFFAKQVATIRFKEFLLMTLGATIKTFNLMIVYAVPPLIALGVFSIYTYTTGQITAGIAFTALSILNTLRLPLVVLPQSLRSFAEFLAAITRLETFLRREEKETFTRSPEYRGIKMRYASFAYPGTANLLKNLTFEIPPGKLCGCIGRVSEGKTNLVHAILGEMNLTKGRFRVGSKIALVPQTPEIFTGTIRENILFGLPYNERKYQLVVFACALTRDFSIMPQRDMTVLADRGANLSGGQRQRVSLARAAYSNADIYLLDSPLSAVDNHTAVHIFTHCVQRLLRGKTRLLISHHIDLLPYCDLVTLMDRGSLSYFGPYTAQFAKVLQKQFPDQKLPEDTGKPLRELINSSPSIDDLFQRQHYDSMDDLHHPEGFVVVGGGPQMGENDGHQEELHIPGVEYTDHVGERHSRDIAEPGPIEMVVPSGDARRGKRRRGLIRGTSSTAGGKGIEATTAGVLAQPHSPTKKKRHSLGIPVRSYLTWIWKNNALLVLISLSIFLLAQVTRIVSDMWIGWWTRDSYSLAVHFYIWIYAVMVVAFIVFLFVRGLFFYVMTLRATTRMHNSMFRRVLRAPMLFYNRNPVGKVVSVFSKDMDSADEALPDAIHVTTIYFMILLTTIVLICVVIPYYIVTIVFLVGTFVAVFLVYTAAAQTLKKEGSRTNGNLFSHIGESIASVVMIRAYNASERFRALTMERIDENHRVVFASQMLQMWMSFRMDLVSSIMVFITAMFAVLMRDSLTSASFGLVISNSFQQLVFTTWVVRGLAEINSLISSVDRIDDYSRNTPQEAPAQIPSTCPPANWPTEGKIEIRNLVLRYEPESEPVLKNISLQIRGGEKVGCVGATGSGKSTTLMTLFRLVEPERGEIFIDGLNIMDMGLTDLRSRLAIIPQETFMFAGTVRSNLDPFDRFTDEQLWEALDKANLEQQIRAMPHQLGAVVKENGSNFSLGQKQLMCLARAILSKSTLLVLDESTASLDIQTDAMIQKIIRKEFQHSTILTIAHRLETIIDSDRILVMDAGKIAEFDTPARLLSNMNGMFTSLVDKAGPEASKNLKAIAFGNLIRSDTVHDLNISPTPSEDEEEEEGERNPLDDADDTVELHVPEPNSSRDTDDEVIVNLA